MSGVPVELRALETVASEEIARSLNGDGAKPEQVVVLLVSMLAAQVGGIADLGHRLAVINALESVTLPKVISALRAGAGLGAGAGARLQ